MWNFLELPESGDINGCEAEIQQLMKQIDGTISTQKLEWQNKLRLAHDELTLKEQEFLVQKNVIEQKNAEITQLQRNVEKLERTHQNLTTYYHDQLMSFKNEIDSMKNEHAKLLKKYGIPVHIETNNPGGNVQKWLTTVDSCNFQISELERERCMLQKQLKSFDDRENVGISSSCKKCHQVNADEINSIDDNSRKLDNSLNNNLIKYDAQMIQRSKKMDGVDFKNNMIGNKTSDEIRKLKLYVIQLQTIIKQKDEQIQLLESNRNDNALIGCLESDLYSAKQEMKTRMKKEESLRDKIKFMEQKLAKSNGECEKLVHQILSMTESEEVSILKKEVASKDVQIIELEGEKERLEEIKNLFEQNETNTKIELQVATAQLNALKTENTNLRRIYITDLSQNNSEPVKYFQDLQQAYYDSLRTLENQNRHLNLTISTLRCDQNLKNLKNNPPPHPEESSVKQTDISTKSSPNKLSSNHSTLKKSFLDDIPRNSLKQQHSKSFRLHKPRLTLNNNNSSSIPLTIDDLYSFGLLQNGDHCMDDDDQGSIEASISTMSNISESFTPKKC